MRRFKKLIGMILMLIPIQFCSMVILKLHGLPADDSFKVSLVFGLIFILGIDLYVEAYRER